MIKIAICDDEDEFLEKMDSYLKRLFKDRSDIVVHRYSDGETLINECDKDNWYDAYFLDIQMKDVDGINVAKRIRRDNEEACIVFVTAYIDYSLEGYRVDAIRYVLKNSQLFEKYVVEAIEVICRNIQCRDCAIEVNKGKKKITIQQGDIEYVESRAHMVILYMSNGEQINVREKLSNILDKLRQDAFCAIHKSFLVNINYVKVWGFSEVAMMGGASLPVSRSNRANIVRFMSNGH